jgi:hypothetical protein
VIQHSPEGQNPQVCHVMRGANTNCKVLWQIKVSYHTNPLQRRHLNHFSCFLFLCLPNQGGSWRGQVANSVYETSDNNIPIDFAFFIMLFMVYSAYLVKDSSAEILLKFINLCYIPHHSVRVRVYFPTQKK